MTKEEIIEHIANNRMVEEIIHNVNCKNDEDLKDLAQDIYLDLYTKPEVMLQTLHETKTLRFFLTRMVLNNIHSKTSRYYSRYKKNNNNKVSIDDLDYDKI